MKTIVLYLMLGIAGASFIDWRIHAISHRQIPHFGIVIDPSRSHAENCESVLGLAGYVLDTEPAQKESTLNLLVVGSTRTANEPWQLATYSVPTVQKVLEGRSAAADRRHRLLVDIKSKCQTIAHTNISPIFLGIKQAVADLRARGCTGDSQCKLWVDSDLAENADPSILTELNGRKSKLPPPIDNEGIATTLCGLAARTGRMIDPSRGEVPAGFPPNDDNVRRVWLMLFTEPKLVSIQPYCPATHSPQDEAATRP